VLAGLACGILANWSFEDALRLGVAAGAANTFRPGAGRLAREDVDDLYDQVKVAAAEY
jgi:fructose-1-phosphate kinase PfkB-like protein